MLQIIDDLLATGLSKYAIAKACGVSWNTIQAWHKEFFRPTEYHASKLLKLYQQSNKEK